MYMQKTIGMFIQLTHYCMKPFFVALRYSLHGSYHLPTHRRGTHALEIFLHDPFF